MIPDFRIILLLALQPVAFLIWSFQNSSPNRLGGPISMVKAFWLVYAITLWILVPVLWAMEHWVFAMWAISMGIRAIIEVPLCLLKRWKVAYGIGHDVVHLILVVIGYVAAPHLVAIAVLTALGLLTEIMFVGWFRKRTAGPDEGVYFVPGGEAYRDLNRKTAFIFLPQYLAFLAWCLFHV